MSRYRTHGDARRRSLLFAKIPGAGTLVRTAAHNCKQYRSVFRTRRAKNTLAATPTSPPTAWPKVLLAASARPSSSSAAAASSSCVAYGRQKRGIAHNLQPPRRLQYARFNICVRVRSRSMCVRLRRQHIAARVCRRRRAYTHMMSPGHHTYLSLSLAYTELCVCAFVAFYCSCLQSFRYIIVFGIYALATSHSSSLDDDVAVVGDGALDFSPAISQIYDYYAANMAALKRPHKSRVRITRVTRIFIRNGTLHARTQGHAASRPGPRPDTGEHSHARTHMRRSLAAGSARLSLKWHRPIIQAVRRELFGRTRARARARTDNRP